MGWMVGFQKSVLAGFLLFSTTIVIAKPLQILSFTSGKLTEKEQKTVCSQAQSLCDDVKKLRSLKMENGDIWVLSGQQIAEFQAQKQGLLLNNKWMIHPEKNINNEDTSSEQEYFIFPKLFPMDQQRYAVALIREQHESYSGGGATIQSADFIELKSKSQTGQFIRGYPFHTSRMIRACFSEQDYLKSGEHCHDLYDLNLDIRVLKPLQWQFRYHYQTEISPVSDSNEKSGKQIKMIHLDLNKVPQVLGLAETWNYQGQE